MRCGTALIKSAWNAPKAHCSTPAPHARQPGLLLDGQARGTVEVLELREARSRHHGVPAGPVVKYTVALAVPAFLAFAPGVGAEQDAARFQRGMQLPEDARQGQAGNVEQCGVGEHAVEARVGQVEFEKILLQHRAAAVVARHRRQPRRAFESGGAMAEFLEGFQVAPGAAAEVEQFKRRRRLDVLQQRGDVLAHVVTARGLPELFGMVFVMRQRLGGDLVEGVGGEGHGWHAIRFGSNRTTVFV